jgi:hypothetical protein
MSTGLFKDEEESYNLEETKYVLKSNAPSTDSSMEDDILPAEPDINNPMDGLEDMESEMGGDKPFDDEPFDAGVEADEDTAPEKFIQQLSGKLGQSLRQYTEDNGQPDFDLEKFAVNSVLSATHTSEMDTEDQRDIINKVKSAGEDNPENGDNGEESDVDLDVEKPEEDIDFGDEPVEEELRLEGDSYFGKDDNFGNDDKFGEDKRWGTVKESEKNSNFTYKIEIMEASEPLVEPVIKPNVKPSRREREQDRPFLPKRKDKVKVPPKAGESIHEDGDSDGKIINTKYLDDKVAIVTVDLNGNQVDMKFENTGEVITKPLAYDEPWVFLYQSIMDDKEYTIGVELLGHPDTNLEAVGVSDDYIQGK